MIVKKSINDVFASGWTGYDKSGTVVTARCATLQEAEEQLCIWYGWRYRCVPNIEVLYNTGNTVLFNTRLLRETRMYTQEEYYWTYAMSHRQPHADELIRLEMILRGYYHALNSEAQAQTGITDFAHGCISGQSDQSRPFGNKNIPQSIIFNLGWDYDRRLTTTTEPQWVTNEAWMLYYALLHKLDGNETTITKD